MSNDTEATTPKEPRKSGRKKGTVPISKTDRTIKQEAYKLAKTFVRCDNIREAIRDKVDINELIGILALEARGGAKRVNGNGIIYSTLPSLDALKLLLEYGYGKPEQSQIVEDADKKKMQELTGLLHTLVMPTNTAVRPDGSLTDDTTIKSAQSVKQSNDKDVNEECLVEVSRN